MAALNFPSNPSVNDTYLASDNRTWVFDGVKWKVKGKEMPLTFSASPEVNELETFTGIGVNITPYGGEENQHESSPVVIGLSSAITFESQDTDRDAPNMTGMETAMTLKSGCVSVNAIAGHRTYLRQELGAGTFDEFFGSVTEIIASGEAGWRLIGDSMVVELSAYSAISQASVSCEEVIGQYISSALVATNYVEVYAEKLYGLKVQSGIFNGATTEGSIEVDKNYGLYVSAGAVVNSLLAASASIGDNYGIYVDSKVSDQWSNGTITRHYGIYIEELSVAETEWGIYAPGSSAKFFFAGSVGIGTDVFTEKLKIVDSPVISSGVDSNGIAILLTPTISEAISETTVYRGLNLAINYSHDADVDEIKLEGVRIALNLDSDAQNSPGAVGLTSTVEVGGDTSSSICSGEFIVTQHVSNGYRICGTYSSVFVNSGEVDTIDINQIYGTYSEAIAQSSVGGSIINVAFNYGGYFASGAAASYGINRETSITNNYGIYCSASAVDSGGGVAAIVNNYGFYLNNSVLYVTGNGAITNHYGIYLEAFANATNEWGIYSPSSTAKHYFNGKVGIGTDSFTERLKIVDAPVVSSGVDVNSVALSLTPTISGAISSTYTVYNGLDVKVNYSDSDTASRLHIRGVYSQVDNESGSKARWVEGGRFVVSALAGSAGSYLMGASAFATTYQSASDWIVGLQACSESFLSTENTTITVAKPNGLYCDTVGEAYAVNAVINITTAYGLWSCAGAYADDYSGCQVNVGTNYGAYIETGAYGDGVGVATITNNYGLRLVNQVWSTPSTGTITNHYGIYLDSFANATNEWGIYSPSATAKHYFNGKVGIGTSLNSAKVHVISTTEQLRLGYDADHYLSFTVGSTGVVTLKPTSNIVIAGNSSTDEATLGSELLAGANWNAGIGWSGDIGQENKYTHTANSGTETLTNSVAISSGTHYQLNYTITERTSGSIEVAFGGVTTGVVSSTGSFYTVTGDEGSLTVTPTTDFDGTCVFSLKAVVKSTALVVLNDSTSNPQLEIRITSQAGNQFIGRESGGYCISGASNTALGYYAQHNLMVGSENTAIGYNAQYNLILGSYNTALGHSAQYSLTTGTHNTAIGHIAQCYLTIGYYNTAVGYGSQSSLTTGFENTSVGYGTQWNLTTGGNNTAIGTNVQGSLTTGGGNTAVGALSQFSLTTANENLAVGYSAQYSLTTGDYDTAIGSFAQYSLTTGGCNTAVGRSAQYSLITGEYNVAIGSDTQYSLTTGSCNIAIGASTQNRLTTGENNTGVGDIVQPELTIGHNNSTFGAVSQGSLTEGNCNSAFGSYAQCNLTTGSENTAVGYNALYNLVTGGCNSALGCSAGSGVSANEGEPPNQTSTHSIYIGYKVRAGADGDTNEIVIGDETVGLGSNTTIIGNSNTTKTRLFGDIATGTNVPSAAIHAIKITEQLRLGYDEDSYASFTVSPGGALTIAPTGNIVIVGNSSTDGPIIGPELLTTNGWTVETGWTESPNDTFTHSQGDILGLSHSVLIFAGLKYQLTYTIEDCTEGSIVVSFGGFTSADLEESGSIEPTALNNNGGLTVTPTEDFDGTCTFSLKIMTASIALVDLYDSIGHPLLSIRATFSDNQFIGNNSGQYCTTGVYNSAFGANAQYNLTTGIYNTAIGCAAQRALISGNNNTAVGASAQVSLTRGGYNNAIGYSSQYSLTSGWYNNAIGDSAQYSLTTGLWNNAIGSGAQWGLTTGDANDAFGTFAQAKITTGSNNTAFGAYAQRNITTGSNNCSFGANAGSFAGANQDENNTSSFSIYIGWDTRANASGDTNEIVIGNETVGLGSNTTVIGNSSTTKIRLFGDIATGLDSPSAAIHAIKTTEQLRLGYDGSHYAAFTVSSAGLLTVAPTSNVVEISGALRLSGSATDTYTTPTNGTVGTKINIPTMTLGGYEQVVMAGISAQSAATAKCFSFLDARTSAHQPTLAVFNPQEDDIFGFSWEGEQTGAYIKSLAAGIGIKINTSVRAAFRANGEIYLDGDTAIGGFTPAAKLHVVKTTEQLRLGYDADKYVSVTVNSSGDTQIDSVGVVKIGDGTNQVKIGTDGTLTLEGTATAWDDLMIPGTSVKTTGNSPPDLLGSFAGDNTLDLYAFDGGSTLEQVFFTIQMPHNWKEGSTIYPHVHFSPVSTNGGDTNERVVRFNLEYTWANIGGTFGATSTITLDSDSFVPNTSQWNHLLAKNASGITATGKTLSSMLVCRLYRDPTNSADTYPQDAAFLQFDVHYEIDSFGSSQEYVK